jgi:UDP-N-acetylglucosamine acyltransferase
MTISSDAKIHPSAVIEEGAVVGEGCDIGPFCLIGPKVVLKPGVTLKSHVVVTGETEIGEGTVVFPFSVLGEAPQYLNLEVQDNKLIIGKRNTIRENVTMNSGSKDGAVTRVGDDGYYMHGCHVAHDATVGNNVILVNSVAIGGHCVIEDKVIVGGLSGVHQFVRIGKGAIIGALTMVNNDVIPYGLVQAPRGKLDGLNLVGLKRSGVSRSDITALRAAFQMLAQGEGSFLERTKRLGDETDSDHVKEIVAFVLGDTERSFLTPN